MSKRRFHEKTVRAKLPDLMFTLEQLMVVRKALVPFEQMIRSQKNPLPNSDLALTTVAQVQAKIQQMMTLNARDEPVSFDSNEITVLRASVWIFLLSLETREPSHETAELKKRCHILCSLLALPQGQKHRCN